MIRLWPCLLCLLWAADVGARTIRLSHPDFLVEGADRAAVFEINEIAREWFRYLAAAGLSLPPAEPPLKIVVVPAEGTARAVPDTPGQSLLLLEEAAKTGLAVRLDAIAGASLARYARFNGLPPALPPVLICGLAEHFLCDLNPARRDELARFALRADQEYSLAETLRSTDFRSRTTRAGAYWIVGALGWPRDDGARWIRAHAGPPEHWFAALMAGDPADADLWFATGLAEFHLTGHAAVWSLEASHWRVRWLATLPAVWRGEVRPVGLEALFDHRRDALASGMAADRSRTAKEWIRRIHPVYHNALHSLGLAFEMLGEPVTRARWEAGVDDFTRDWAEARTLHAEIREALAD